jgi:hypothetical protein
MCVHGMKNVQVLVLFFVTYSHAFIFHYILSFPTRVVFSKRSIKKFSNLFLWRWNSHNLNYLCVNRKLIFTQMCVNAPAVSSRRLVINCNWRNLNPVNKKTFIHSSVKCKWTRRVEFNALHVDNWLAINLISKSDFHYVQCIIITIIL